MPAALDARFSLDLLVKAQSPNGAIPASTVHEVYRYGWLRDGSWCAYAMDRGGRPDAAARWHHWVAETLLRHEHRVEEALAAVAAGRVDGRVMMPARFTLAGEEEPVDPRQEWPNFQTDCYGFWLWAVADHARRNGGTVEPTVERAMRLVVRYLMGAGETPCYDCWEEYPGLLHTSSLAAVSAGLRDAGALLGEMPPVRTPRPFDSGFSATSSPWPVASSGPRAATPVWTGLCCGWPSRSASFRSTATSSESR